MALPTFVGVGTYASGNGDIVPGLPTGLADGDWCYLVVETTNSQTPTAPANWTEIANSPQTSAAGSTDGVKLSVYRRKREASAFGAPTVVDSGNHQSAVIFAIRGADGTTPIHVSAGDAIASASASITFPAVTTSVADCLIVNILAHGIDSSGNHVTGAANASLANVAERFDEANSQSSGGGIAVITGEKASAGSTGSTTATLASADGQARITLAFQPPASGGGAVTGTLDATESGSDTFAASGEVDVSGTLAATDSGSDTFSGTGSVGAETRYVAPGASGTGASWADPAPITSLDDLIGAVGAGGTVKIRADAGDVYSLVAQLSIDNAGASGNPVTIEFVQSDGSAPASDAWIEGTRDSWTHDPDEEIVTDTSTFTSKGINCFNFRTGSGHLTFVNMRLRRFLACFQVASTATADVPGIRLTNPYFYNVSHAQRSNATGFSFTDFVVTTPNAIGFSAALFQLNEGAANGSITGPGTLDSRRQSGDSQSVSGFHAIDCSNISIDGITVKNCHWENGSLYWNGDGFSVEENLTGITITNCVSSGHADGGYDLKSAGTYTNLAANDNKVNFRLWNVPITLDTPVSDTPNLRGGTGIAAHFGIYDPTALGTSNHTVNDATVTEDATGTLVYAGEGNDCTIHFEQYSIPSTITREFSNPGITGTVITFNPPWGVSGTLTAVETGSDTFAGSGTVPVSGTLVATETGSDAFAATGFVGDAPAITGTMDAVEIGSDTAAFVGTVEGAEQPSGIGGGAGGYIMSRRSLEEAVRLLKRKREKTKRRPAKKAIQAATEAVEEVQAALPIIMQRRDAVETAPVPLLPLGLVEAVSDATRAILEAHEAKRIWAEVQRMQAALDQFRAEQARIATQDEEEAMTMILTAWRLAA